MARIGEAYEVNAQQPEDATAALDAPTWVAFVGGFVIGVIAALLGVSMLFYAN